MISDPFLNYFALGLLIFVVVVIFYGIIAIHDIPAKIAEARHHPHADAIHAAGTPGSPRTSRGHSRLFASTERPRSLLRRPGSFQVDPAAPGSISARAIGQFLGNDACMGASIVSGTDEIG